MDVSIFLAKVIGLYLLIMAIALFVNGQKIKPIMSDLVRNPALMFMIGFICLILGLLLVIGHNLWVADWRVLITIIGWLTLIKGVSRVIYPQMDSKMVNFFLESHSAIYIAALIDLVLGVFLIYFGFSS